MFKKKESTEKQNPVRKKNRKGNRWVVLTAVGLAAGIGGALFWQNASRKAKTAGAGASGQRTATVTKGTLVSELSSSGTISPKNTYSITSLVEGDVTSADFEEGDQVSKGQVLYQIDASSMESDLKSAGNSLTRASGSYERAVLQYNEAVSAYSGNTYKSTRSGFIKELRIQAGDKVSSNTEIALIYNDGTMKITVPFLAGEAASIGAGNQATVTLTDTGEQLSGTVVSVSNMDEVLGGGRIVRRVSLEVSNPGGLTTSHSASVTVGGFVCCEEGNFEPVTDAVMKASVTGNGSLQVESLLVHEGDYVTQGTPIFLIREKDVEDILQSYRDSVDSAQEKVESAQSKVDTTEKSYKNYTITAPISGQVITKSVKVGDKVSKSSGNASATMAVIYDMSEMTFEMSVDELDVQKVKIGQKVDVTADAYEGKTFTGTVTNISLESSQSNGVTNYPVTVTLDDAGELLPGMNVDGKIILDQAEDALIIPGDSLMRGNRVYIKDSTVKEAQGSVPAGFRAVEVETGLTNDDYVQILSGVSEGDEVYVSESSKNTANMFQMGGPGGMGGAPGGMGGAPTGGGNRNGGGMP